MIKYVMPVYFVLCLFPVFSKVGLPEQVGKLCLLSALFLCMLKKTSHTAFEGKPSKISLYFIFSIVLLSVVHLIMYGKPNNPLRLLSWLGVLFMMSSFSFTRETSVMVKSIRVVVLVIDVLLLYVCISHGNLYFYRAEVAMFGIDKPTITFFYTLYFAIAYIDVLHGRNVKLNFLLFVLTFFVNIYVAQSKLALTSFVLFMVLYYLINNDPSIKTRTKRIIRLVIFGVVLLWVINPELISIPDEFRIMINQICGRDIFEVSKVLRGDNTYSIRSTIQAYCIRLFFENPLVGIGLGNYRFYAGSEVTFDVGRGNMVTIHETESQFLGMLVEGGLWYVISFAIFVGYSIYTATHYMRKNVNVYENSVCLAILVPVTYICFGNDFFSVNFWLLIGFCTMLVGLNLKGESNDFVKKGNAGLSF